MESRGNESGLGFGGGTGGRAGGATSETRNVISGNHSGGLHIGGSSRRVQGNFIGVGADGVTPLGNGGSGVSIGISNPTDVIIGGFNPGESNIIAYSGDY